MTTKVNVSVAEWELLQLISRANKDGDDQNFTITIHADGDRWDVRVEYHDIGDVSTGTGNSFDKAWDNQLDGDILDPRTFKPWKPRPGTAA